MLEGGIERRVRLLDRARARKNDSFALEVHTASGTLLFDSRGPDAWHLPEPVAVEAIDGPAWGGNGRLFQVLGGPEALAVEHNTAFQSGPIVFAEGPQSPGFVFRNNTTNHNDGIDGTGTRGHGPGRCLTAPRP